MDSWTAIRFLHIVALAFFVGGQLVLAAAVVPALRGQEPGAMRRAARRFGVGSVIALAVLVATGVAMASRADRWQDSALQLKLLLLVVVVVLTALHAVTPYTRAISATVLVLSVVIVWLGVGLSHG